MPEALSSACLISEFAGTGREGTIMVVLAELCNQDAVCGDVVSDAHVVPPSELTPAWNWHVCSKGLETNLTKIPFFMGVYSDGTFVRHRPK